MRLRSLVFMVLVACGRSSAPEPVVRGEVPAATPVTPATATPRVVEPTVLTAEQLRRDREVTPLATTIVDAHSNWLGWYTALVAFWSPDGSRVLYGSTRAGMPQLHAADPARPAEPARALTTGPERAIWGRYTVDGKYVVFLRDRAGDEKMHLWRVDAEGSTPPIDLTADLDVFPHEPVFPRGRPDMMAYSAQNYEKAAASVYVQSIAGGPPRLVYTHPTWAWLGAITADGARGVFGSIEGWDNVVLHELDMTSGALRRIYPPTGKGVNIYNIAYSSDDSLLYLTTDENVEPWHVLALDARTFAERARYTSPSPPGAALSVLPSPTGEHLAVHVDAGNHAELRILDGRTLALQRPVPVPLGDVKLGSFRDDGQEFSIMISLPDRPADIYAVDPATAAVRPLREEPRPGLEALAKVTATIAEVPAHDGLTIPINVYLPADLPAGERRATIAIFHGGPRYSSTIRWDPQVRFLLARGYVVIEPNVRGSTGFGRVYEAADNREKRREWLHDLATVNAWARTQPWCDLERIVVFGASYGGYTTLMALSRQPTLWRAGVDLFGPADLPRFLGEHVKNGAEDLWAEWGAPAEYAEVHRELSPMRDADKIAAPLFVYAGQNDPRVPRSESDSIVQALRDRGVPVEYMVAANEGHTVDRRENQIELLARIARFLDDAL